MRLKTCLIALATLASILPGGARADDDRDWTPRRSEPDVRSEAEGRPTAPAPEDRRDALGPYPRSAPAPRPYAGPRRYRAHPRFGWGWGWYPLYPYGPPPAADDGAPPRERDDRDRVYTRISVYGAGMDDGYVAGLDLNIEGRYTGFELDLNALASEQVTGSLHDSGSDPIGWSTAHVTWAVLSERSFRLRLETGASLLSMPDSEATFDREWRGKTVVGPDVGLSGQLGLLGPVGIEGHARLTPFPVRTADAFLGLAIHQGPLGVSAGWRWIDVDGDDQDAPKVWFRGPQVGLTLGF